MERRFRVYRLLLPLSWLYGCAVRLRNLFYDKGWLKSHDWTRWPVVCVGNLTVGGTGKTPHVEYLCRLLQGEDRVAVLSRGYRRRSKGYVCATSQMPSALVGDEPWQIKHKMPDVEVAVCRDRDEGLRRLFGHNKARLAAVILDDAFQHRRVRVGMNLVLTDYHRLASLDAMLPAGRLREPIEGLRRAQVVIVTKCPDNLSADRQREIAETLHLNPSQHLFFSSLRYDRPISVFHAPEEISWDALSAAPQLLLVSGIAVPQILEHDVRAMNPHVVSLHFGDHHDFTPSDVEKINRAFDRVASVGGFALTTEKDAARLRFTDGLSTAFKTSLYALPVKVEFLNHEEETFNPIILDYVRKNRRNRPMA